MIQALEEELEDEDCREYRFGSHILIDFGVNVSAINIYMRLDEKSE